MKRDLVLGTASCVAILVMLTGYRVDAGSLQLSTAGATHAPHRAMLDTYCVTCHNQRLKTGGLSLDTVDIVDIEASIDLWERVLRELRTGTMPPSGRPRPDPASVASFLAYLEGSLDAGQSQPGRTAAVRRLTRAQYTNAVRDLLGFHVDAESLLLPADAPGKDGFDTMTEGLSVSPALLERYIANARKLSHLAIGAPLAPTIEAYEVPINLLQHEQLSEDLPFGSRGGAAIRHTFPLDGEYSIQIRLHTNYSDHIRGLARPHRLEVRLDGELVRAFMVGGEGGEGTAPDSYEGSIFGSTGWEYYVHHADDELNVRVPIRAGTRIVGVSFASETWEAEGVEQPRQSGFALASNAMMDDIPAVSRVEIAGPYSASGPGDTASRRKILICRPHRPADESRCAEQILSVFARRAYRRPVTDADIDALLAFYEEGHRAGGFESGIQAGLEAVLAAPDFIFRIERDNGRIAAGQPYRISDVELASRLSFFLWSSIPDDELFDLAVRERLQDGAVLEQQVRRMLTDPRTNALVTDFFGQWLHFRNVRTHLPDALTFPEFDDNLREAFEKETTLFLRSQLAEDRSVVELLDADYTFLNERLARHYGIPHVSGNRFRRVLLPDPMQRRGLLGQGSILMVTSYPDRTSPVLRGKWLLDNLLGASVPPPPPNVPALPTRGEGGTVTSVRQRLAQHRTNPVCATCHAQMDPLGFALDHFDAIGGWRDVNEGNTPVDASGVLPNGEKFNGPGELRSVLLGRREQFVGVVVEKLLLYGLGRPIETNDMPVIRKIVRDSRAGDYRWSAIMTGIVRSVAFQMRMAGSGPSVPRQQQP